MKKIIIAAVSANNVIGNKNNMPWTDKSEMKHFRETTIGNAVLMGHNTFSSIGTPLKDRINLVLSNSKTDDSAFENLYYFNSIDKAYKFSTDLEVGSLFIIGGSEVFAQTINEVDELLISRIPITIEGDKYFPEIDAKVWVLESKTNSTSFVVEKYLRKKSK